MLTRRFFNWLVLFLINGLLAGCSLPVWPVAESLLLPADTETTSSHLPEEIENEIISGDRSLLAPFLIQFYTH